MTARSLYERLCTEAKGQIVPAGAVPAILAEAAIDVRNASDKLREDLRQLICLQLMAELAPPRSVMKETASAAVSAKRTWLGTGVLPEEDRAVLLSLVDRVVRQMLAEDQGGKAVA